MANKFQILNSKEQKKTHHRFFVPANAIKDGFFKSADFDLINQIKNVFRLRMGDEIVIFDGLSNQYEVIITSLDTKSIRGKIISSNKKSKNKTKINLYCSLLKGDHFEMVLEKCTELGVDSFHPVVFDRSIIRELKAGKIERYRKIVKEAAEQSGRIVLPEIADLVDFTKAIKKTAGELNLAGIIEAPINVLEIKTKLNDVNIFIGPEGDFSENELNIMEKADFQFFNLGSNVLRSETAVIVSCGVIIQNMLKSGLSE